MMRICRLWRDSVQYYQDLWCCSVADQNYNSELVEPSVESLHVANDDGIWIERNSKLKRQTLTASILTYGGARSSYCIESTSRWKFKNFPELVSHSQWMNRRNTRELFFSSSNLNDFCVKREWQSTDISVSLIKSVHCLRPEWFGFDCRWSFCYFAG